MMLLNSINYSLDTIERHLNRLQMISERFSSPITELTFIGDEEKDRRTAMNANCKFIQIQRTEKNKESISNLNQLLQVLE